MTKLVTILSLLTTISAPALADQRSDKFLANALINFGVQKEVKEFSNLVNQVSKVTFANENSDSDSVTLSGMALKGGDMACGTVSLKITSGAQMGPFGGTMITYSAQVIKNEAIDKCMGVTK